MSKLKNGLGCKYEEKKTLKNAIYDYTKIHTKTSTGFLL